MRRRYELSQRQWERIEGFFPHTTHQDRRGRPWEDHRHIFNGILWRLHTGAPWRDIPERYGPWETIYGRFRRWTRDSTWAKVLTHLLEDLERHGRLGRELNCGSSMPPSSAPAGRPAERRKEPEPVPVLRGPPRRNSKSRLNMRRDTRAAASAPR